MGNEKRKVGNHWYRWRATALLALRFNHPINLLARDALRLNHLKIYFAEVALCVLAIDFQKLMYVVHVFVLFCLNTAMLYALPQRFSDDRTINTQ